MSEEMDEAAARDVVLMRAVESSERTRTWWSDVDRDWATRAAAEFVTASATDDAFLRYRAALVRERLIERVPPLGRALQAWIWPRWLGPLLVIAALIVGFAIDRVGDDGRINILAPPVLGLCAWNFVIYALLLWRAFARVFRRRRGIGQIRAALIKLGSRGVIPRRLGSKAPLTAIVTAFSATWSPLLAPLHAARATRVLHLAAAAVAIGVIASLYLRGIAFEYRASWQSTFLDAVQVHDVLAFVLAPASRLTGLPVPSIGHIASIRSATAGAGENAAAWVHLYATTVTIVVIVPRLLLALLAGFLARRRALRIPLQLADPYYRRLVRTFRDGPLQVLVVPYGITLIDASVDALRTLLTRAFGRSEVEVTQVVPYGGEDSLPTGLIPAGVHLVLPVFSLSATPEAATHGAFLHVIRRGARADCVAMVDESSFRERWSGDEARLGERRDAWAALFANVQVPGLFVHLASIELEPGAESLQQAVERRAA